MKNNEDLIKYIKNNHNKIEGRICIGNHSFTTTKLWADSEEEFAVMYRDDLKQLIENLEKEFANQKNTLSENKVFVERAAPLTSEGIKAVCGSEKDYDKYLKALNSENQNKNPAYFCDCGKYLGHRGFCSEECHNKHYDGKSESSEEWVLNYCPNCKQMTNHLQDGNCLKCGVNCSVLSELNEGGEK